jgi:hypothetical protein
VSKVPGALQLKDASCLYGNWDYALNTVKTLASGICGLSDGSDAGDWHLPNKNELWSLVDYGSSSPALPTGHPFSTAQYNLYWSSTSYAVFANYAWAVDMHNGMEGTAIKSNNYYVWPTLSNPSAISAAMRKPTVFTDRFLNISFSIFAEIGVVSSVGPIRDSGTHSLEKIPLPEFPVIRIQTALLALQPMV